MRVCLRVSERESVCVCVCVRERWEEGGGPEARVCMPLNLAGLPEMLSSDADYDLKLLCSSHRSLECKRLEFEAEISAGQKGRLQDARGE